MGGAEIIEPRNTRNTRRDEVVGEYGATYGAFIFFGGEYYRYGAPDGAGGGASGESDGLDGSQAAVFPR